MMSLFNHRPSRLKNSCKQNCFKLLYSFKQFLKVAKLKTNGEVLAIVSEKTPDGRSYSLDENKLVSCAHALPVLAGKIFFVFFTGHWFWFQIRIIKQEIWQMSYFLKFQLHISAQICYLSWQRAFKYYCMLWGTWKFCLNTLHFQIKSVFLGFICHFQNGVCHFSSTFCSKVISNNIFQEIREV